MKETLELDLKEIVKILIKRAWIICLCAVIAGAAVYGYIANFVTPMYRAEVTMYVNNNANNANAGYVSSANLAVALQLVKTYVNIISSDMVLEKVAQDTDLQLTAGQIRGMLSAAAVNETEMFAVRITSPNPQMSADIANSIAKIAPGEISKIIEGSSAKVVDDAKVPKAPVSPGYMLKTALGAALGAVMAAAFFVVQNLLDTHVKNEEELEKIYAFPVLGTIPDFSQPAKDSRKKVGK